ncbi:carbohydrate-binding, CenC-like protein [Tanacetum coccineum]
MGRYSGQVISWDVVNENMHFNFFESKLGDTTSLSFYTTTRALVSNVLIPLNHLGIELHRLIITFRKLNRFQMKVMMVHFNFFESKLGDTASSSFYTTTRALVSNVSLFLNDFDTIESPGDRASSPDNYL